MNSPPQAKQGWRLLSPQLDFSETGVPRSLRFGDTYFDGEDGLLESTHVFHKGCEIPHDWAGRDKYVIGELGFGTGLNFLATWSIWRQTAPLDARLHYLSIDRFPIPKEDLKRCLNQWPELTLLKSTLVDSYPTLLPGTHRLFLENSRVVLTLIFGDVLPALQGLETSVNAWFLDGFSPSKNPEMWQPKVFSEIARLSKANTRIATYTVAGQVRRNLNAAGFVVKKRSGTGKKRAVLSGLYGRQERLTPTNPWYSSPPSIQKRKPRIIIIGGGLAGAQAAYAFMRRGCDVKIIEETSGLAQRTSSIPAAVMMPRVTASESLDGSYFASAWRFSLDLVHSLQKEIGEEFFTSCGALQLAATRRDEERLRQASQAGPLTTDSAKYLEPNDASLIAGLSLERGGLYFPESGLVNVPALCGALTTRISVMINAVAHRFEDNGTNWSVFDKKGYALGTADIVVIANGLGSSCFDQTSHLPLTARLGQISTLEPTDRSRLLACILSNHGHLTPTVNGQHSVGATFDHVRSITSGNFNSAPTADADNRNVKRANTILTGAFRSASAVAGKSWTGIRCTTQDHLPIAGPAPDFQYYQTRYHDLKHGRHWIKYPPARYHRGLFILTGLGARGLVTAPLAAELIACQALGEPPPLPRKLVQALHPGRFIVRALRKDRK
ncbi:MAG: bifunctional tRNA (5-methylaminomethyl-2-thiouridine)(34)-methyltransferase MnmD/FAD-dependent 5-carboxymethylaminomethyl-2-thiouridine(34) oxidoreductase MnmC [Rhodospirillaceae bacterium]